MNLTRGGVRNDPQPYLVRRPWKSPRGWAHFSRLEFWKPAVPEQELRAARRAEPRGAPAQRPGLSQGGVTNTCLTLLVVWHYWSNTCVFQSGERCSKCWRWKADHPERPSGTLRADPPPLPHRLSRQGRDKRGFHGRPTNPIHHICHVLPFQPLLWNRYVPSEPANTAKHSPQSISEGGRIWQVRTSCHSLF